MHFLAFPNFLPSAVGDLSDVKLVAGDAVELRDLPLFAGHAAVMGWYDCMASFACRARPTASGSIHTGCPVGQPCLFGKVAPQWHGMHRQFLGVCVQG